MLIFSCNEVLNKSMNTIEINISDFKLRLKNWLGTFRCGLYSKAAYIQVYLKMIGQFTAVVYIWMRLTLESALQSWKYGS